MADLSKNEMREIAHLLVNRSMRIGRRPDGEFESVRLIYNTTDPSCVTFATMVEEECWKVGAHVLLVPHSWAREQVRHSLMPEAALGHMGPLQRAVLEHIDVNIHIGESDDPNWIQPVADRYRITGPVRQLIREIIDERKVRWVYFGWPLPGAAKGYGVELDRFRQIFFDSIRASLTERVLQLCRYYGTALDGKDVVEVRADDGTQLTMRILGRPVLVDDGIISPEDVAKGDVGNNIPAGEVFIAPLETTANGRIVFEEVSTQGFGNVKNLRLEFQDGKVVKFDADEGTERFQKFLDSNVGEKDRIAELGIGCNPGAQYTGGSIIIDEKIFGTIHVAIGNNTGAYHGVNKASSHLDMIKDMRASQLLIDGQVVMDRGRPTVSL